MDDDLIKIVQKQETPNLKPLTKKRVLTEAQKKWNPSPFPWKFVLSLAAIFVIALCLNKSISNPHTKKIENQSLTEKDLLNLKQIIDYLKEKR